MTGEIKVEDATLESKKDIEELLQSICETVSSRWYVRQNQTEFQEMCFKAFADPRVSSAVNDEEVDDIKDYLKNAINSAPGKNSDAYVANEMLPGFLIWRQYLKAHKAWKQCITSLGRESLDVHSSFI